MKKLYARPTCLVKLNSNGGMSTPCLRPFLTGNACNIFLYEYIRILPQFESNINSINKHYCNYIRRMLVSPRKYIDLNVNTLDLY